MSILTPTQNWFFALLVGATMITFYFWHQFDEPSYDSSTEYFAKYKPRFSTYATQYVYAKYEYVLLFLGVYLIFSFVPEIFYTLVKAPTTELQSPTVVPVLAALALISFQKATITKDFERHIRAAFHSLAQVPEGVRRTVAQIRASELNMNKDALSLQTRKLGSPPELDKAPDTILNLIRDDLPTFGWYRIGCVLFALAEHNRKETGIELVFFDLYQEELQTINSHHAQLGEAIKKHIHALSRNPALLRPGVVNDSDLSLFAELNKLADRLYTFVACGVRSSVKTAVERAGILKNLGFLQGYSPQPKGNTLAIIGIITGLSIIAIMIISVFTGFLTGIFQTKVLTPLGGSWIAAFPIPKDILRIYLWSWTTAFFYAAAIITAIAVRQSRIATRKWFDIDGLKRERPIVRYIVPTLLGAACGAVTLVIIAFTSGPGFHFELPKISDLGEAIQLSLPWYPLAAAIAAISLWLVDGEISHDRPVTPILRSLCAGYSWLL